MTSFHAGQTVVCADAAGFPQTGGETKGERYPQEGRTYTVRAVRRYGDAAELLVEGIVNPTRKWDDGREGELGFDARRFRPKILSDLHRAKRGTAALVTCIVQTLNESDPTFQARFLKRLTDAHYEIRDNYDGRWSQDVNQELELLSWTRELLTGWDMVSGQGKPFLGR